MGTDVDENHARIVSWRNRVWHAIHQARTAPAFVQAANAEGRWRREQVAVQGWEALNNQRYAQAEQLFRAALHDEPYAISGWLGLSRASASGRERRAYQQTVLDLLYLVDQLQSKQLIPVPYEDRGGVREKRNCSQW